MVFRTTYLCLTAAASVLLLACADGAMPPPPGAQPPLAGQQASPAGHPAAVGGGGVRPFGSEFASAPSFDECYPWEPDGKREPPTLQLNSRGGPKFTFLFVMPGRVTFSGEDFGWESKIDDAEFSMLWNLSIMARRQHMKGEDVRAGESGGYTLAIGCGVDYAWLILVNDAFAETKMDAAAQLTKELLDLTHNPPPNATD